jgi:hypothetical protein
MVIPLLVAGNAFTCTFACALLYRPVPARRNFRAVTVPYCTALPPAKSPRTSGLKISTKRSHFSRQGCCELRARIEAGLLNIGGAYVAGFLNSVNLKFAFPHGAPLPATGY